MATTKKPVKKTTASKGKQITLQEIPPSVWTQIWTLLKTTFFGRVLLFLAIFSLVVGIDILIAQNSFERFTLMLGIEVIILALACWLVYLVRNRDNIFNSSED